MAQLITNIGWDVRTSLEEGRARDIEDHVWSRQSDAEQLAIARDLDRILISFDQFKGKDGAEVAAELHLNGGWIIQIASGPDQPIYRALAKLLWHYDQWTTFLGTQHGAVLLRDLRQNPDVYTVEAYRATKLISDSTRHYFDEYMDSWRDREIPQRAPRPVLSPEEQLLMTRLQEEPDS